MQQIARALNLRRLTPANIRSLSGLILGVYVLMHLANHSLGLISLAAQEAARPWIMALWHSAPGQGFLYGSLLAHAALGLRSVALRRHFRLPRWEAAQLIMGLLIPYLLLVHIVNTRGTRITTGIDIDYEYEIANLWIDPWIRLRQVALVLLVWGHFVAGLHYWLRLRGWYRRSLAWILAGYLLVPAFGLLGFAEAGKGLSAQAREQPAWWAAIKTRGVPASPRLAARRALLKQWAGPAWLLLVGAVFAGTILRNRRGRRHRFTVTYPKGATVSAPVGMTVLEVSRMARRPHLSVCGGRGRCTTCRIRVHGSAQWPASGEVEAFALARLGSPAGLRLACQMRPEADLEVEPLVDPANRPPDSPTGESRNLGEELRVTVLFLDVRGSTTLAEKRLPFDVVFLMSHFFAEMAAAVDSAGGHYSNFTGDGLMALFGLEGTVKDSARQALTCALDMIERLERMNERMAGELERPLAIGLGVHTGLAIVGRMGPPKTPILTALGDTVNTTARLESMTKELGVTAVVSLESLAAAELEAPVPTTHVALKGRAARMGVVALDRQALASCLGFERAGKGVLG